MEELDRRYEAKVKKEGGAVMAKNEDAWASVHL